jgi:integrase
VVYTFTYYSVAAYPKYLVKRKQGFYAVVEIPKALRHAFNSKPRFLQSLTTTDQRVAERRLPIVIARWKELIEKAKGNHDPATNFMWELMEWRKAIASETDDENKSITLGIATDWLEALKDKKGDEAATEAAAVIFDNVQPLLPNFLPWTQTIKHLAAKTQDLQKLSVNHLCNHFNTTAKIDKAAVKQYLTTLKAEKNLSDKTLSLRLTFMRNFIGYLDDEHGTNLLPLFTMAALGRNISAKTAKQRAWIPFTAEQVSKLYQAALEKKKPDYALADLIAFGAYTGCRIEELAQLKSVHFTLGGFRVEDSKTSAGIREVPLHPALANMVKRLKEKAADGFLLDGSDEGAFGKRSDALGKRFGHLKTKLGFGDQHVFHSIRKTVVSQLEQAGVNENITADIVGHDKPRITYGLYSAGASMAQKADALSRVAYDRSLGTPL